ncbi:MULTISPECIES: hypothetical protein [Oceanibaculum]|uniref:Uncharacterized protein n=1 Tax=Oceanibaculum indicum TaxID=526216 RepID=A0A420WN33_9PROT|nr:MULTISPECIES: hypothetical protein [Oceanibaculum]MCH2396317.1 hypothetical protein [Oceanibaculum sp.]RKQ72400.1 hypothetical protein BCL74_0164 [Oceanibaculum indicum]
MSTDFPQKLRLIQIVTGCATQKEMYARFKALNPHTGYDPQRAYKWLQGRSSPRDMSVFEDIARLLDLDVPGEAVRNSTIDEFRTLIEARRGPLPAEVAPEALGGALRLPTYLAGRFLAIARAWAPDRRDCLLAGILTLTPDATQGIGVHYQEYLPAGHLVLTGAMQRIGRSARATAINEEDETFIDFCLQIPPAPAPVLYGILSGAAIQDLEMRPSACPLICLRADAVSSETLCKASGYYSNTPESASDLALVAGLAGEQATTFGAKAHEFLNASEPGLISVTPSELAPLIASAYSQA